MKYGFTRKHLFACFAVGVFGMSYFADAAITAVDIDYYTLQGTGDTDAGASSYSIAGVDLNSGAAIDLTGASKLVVTISAESGINATSGSATVNTLTYGGAALTQIVEHGTGRSTSVWYLDLAGASLAGTDLDINFDGSAAYMGVALYSLSGTAAGYSAQASSGNPGAGNALEITTLTANEFVVTTMGRNNFDNDGAAGIGIIAPLTEVFYGNLIRYTAAAAYRTTDAAGAYNLVINDTSSSTTTFSAASFEAVPEPGSLALLGMGALCVLRRRRD